MEEPNWVCFVFIAPYFIAEIGFSYAPPFDRHDWIVDRCGTKIRYVIDFYTGKNDGSSNNLSFFLDVRPALDNWEGVRMRAEHFWERLFGKWGRPSISSSSSSVPKPTTA